MIQDIRDSADAVGISAFITNSKEKIETQLNRLNKETDLPTMLISWDIDVTLDFDENGFLKNPTIAIVALLVSKPEDLAKETQELTSIEMGELFQLFIRDLHQRLRKFQKDTAPPITNASYKLVPKHGTGMHSGVLGRFSMRVQAVNC